MAGEDRRSVELAFLHPAIRERVQAIQHELNGAGFNFHIFEAFRSPQRQAYLYAQGRTRPGNIVTYARPWTSYHQYGLAVDFVLKTNGNWDWSDGRANAVAWKQLHKIGRAHGMEPLNFETPHLQMAGLRVENLHAGHLPPGGDADWAENLEAAIAGWSGSPQPPPAPMAVSRPALAPGAAVTATAAPSDVDRPASSASTVMTSNNFARIQPFIEKWEGGYSNHPSDRGGPTNMGITLATLRTWRQNDSLTAEDVKQLSRDEARRIFKARYYDVVRGDDLPLQVAAAVYNAAVLHGTGRSAEFLQNSLVSCGAQVSVDRIIGPETLGAVGVVEVPRLCKVFLDIEDAYFRALPEFPVFGKGWLNRLNDMRSFIATLPAEPIVVATGGTTVSEQPKAQPYVAEVLTKIEELLELFGQKPNPPIASTTHLAANDTLSRIGQIVDVLRQLGLGVAPVPTTPGAATTRPLTPVNGALGQTIGNLLDGKKSAIGIIGSVLTALLGAVAPAAATSGAAGAAGGLMGILSTLGVAVPYLQPIMLGLAAWGALGKFDKWRVAAQAQAPKTA
ncbi:MULTISPECIES: glycosyl hydrolase 108 family protein [Bradyrhizobium]|uniref:glycosyl hydrolase 108 family protein n=1 Tax=Bradyrhizobium elkanii TaxID=29448 RepID=UPI0004163AAC|nr:glycosyl hydrolase 108 family protein [Bradyrhizobium elkanii]